MTTETRTHTTSTTDTRTPSAGPSAAPPNGRTPTAASTHDGPVPTGQDYPPRFALIGGGQVEAALRGRAAEVLDLVEETYRVHGGGDTVNPPSYFLRFPDRPLSRIIALPASLGGRFGVDGLKWVSSFPGNIEYGLPRASALLLLNDHDTGYPFACLEGSIISATRTAASAALGADRLSRGRPRPRRVGFVGAGLIARYIHTYLAATGWEFDEVGIYDPDPDSAHGLAGSLTRSSQTPVVVHDDIESVIRGSDLVVFATVAARPHVTDESWFDHHPVVLHVSLRDLTPEILLGAVNVVDDVDHCLKADTSPHLVEQLTGSRDFIAGTLDDVMAGRAEIPPDRTVVFSPFGLGVLDLAVGLFVYEAVARAGELNVVDGFFHDLARHG
ncbi:2,3-diaminopropionate biosynthesis protein SbnB [Agilicoccus flavus]|uniref:2,3-diaminopropionate biosynthesis protein SbnB n=1 Tax=Agilicoccus flavus TaxID=2775968 RepID=UPI001CF6A107|nr:2,3-diaminopropionate biosynthesis protein SbnB [Agilicoccus flavus]